MALFEKKTVEKIDMTITDEESFKRWADDFIEHHVPMEYNQIQLVRELFNDELDHYISISNRADGKSFNYIHFFMNLSIEKGIGFTLVARHYTVRFLLQDFVRKLADKSDIINTQDIMFRRGDFFTTIIHRDKEIGIITDLNQATDLKYASNYIEDFPIIIYDEFLALEGDYLPDEWDKLKTIYASIDRVKNRPFIKFPKVFYLGNAVNFSSPILAALDLFNLLEKHQIDTMKQYGNILLEMRKNEQTNVTRNTRAFNEKDDDMTKGQFTINYYKIANEKDRQQINLNPKYIYVKLTGNYLKITYNPDNEKVLLSIVNFAEDYTFNLKLNDNKVGSTYLNENYFDERHYKKYEKGIFLFDNNFSKDTITSHFTNLEQLKIFKIIREHEMDTRERPDFERNEEVYKENYIERTKRALLKRFL